MKILVEGMSCGHCSKAVKEGLLKIEGIRDVSVNLEKKEVEILGENFSEDKVREKVEDLGYEIIG